MLILKKDDNISKYFRCHKNEKYILNKWNIKNDYKKWVKKI